MVKNEKKTKVIIFEKGHRPKENYYGLLLAAINNSNTQSKLINRIFNSSKDILEFKFFELDLLKSKSSKKNIIKNFFINFYYLYRSNLVFGNFPIYLRLLLFILNWKGNYICIPPGKITKATGYFKENNFSILKILKNLISYKFLKTYILACDELDKIYLSAAHSYPIESIIISKYPKYFWMNKDKKNYTKEPKILFAPTEREKGSPSPITKLLENKQFIEKVLKRGFSIFYSHHIHDLNSTENIDNKVKRFDSNWNDIKIVITDYSSIGADFLHSRGGKVIYYTNDKKEFIKNYGSGPLFDLEMKNGYECISPNNLLEFINLDQDQDVSKNYPSSKDFFEDILSKVN